MMKLYTKVWLSMSSIKRTIPTGPKVLPLVVFTHRDLCVMSTLCHIFIYKWHEIHEHVAPVPNGAMTGSL